jgi:predicted ribosomally synthesized peptide with SipW-like signal peptide
MSNNSNTTTVDTERGRRHRKVAAILAGGLVMGIGTMATLASWNDSEYATATFTSGTFKLQGSADGSTFSDHATAGDAAALTFTAPFGNLSPNDVTYAPFAVRLTADTTNNATVTVTNPGTDGDVRNLTYSLIETESFGCDANSTGTVLVADAAVGSEPHAQTFDLSMGTGGADGAAANLCFVVTAGHDLVQDQSGTSTWRFQAVSK